MGEGAVVSCLSKYIHPSLWVRNHHLNIGKGHQLEGMTVLRRELNIFDNASFRLNHLMSRDQFDSILKVIGYTIWPAPDYQDHFHEFREMIEAWNENMQNNFKPGHIVCLYESMSTWTNMHTCPGLMFVT